MKEDKKEKKAEKKAKKAAKEKVASKKQKGADKKGKKGGSKTKRQTLVLGDSEKDLMLKKLLDEKLQEAGTKGAGGVIYICGQKCCTLL